MGWGKQWGMDSRRKIKGQWWCEKGLIEVGRINFKGETVVSFGCVD